MIGRWFATHGECERLLFVLRVPGGTVTITAEEPVSEAAGPVPVLGVPIWGVPPLILCGGVIMRHGATPVPPFPTVGAGGEAGRMRQVSSRVVGAGPRGGAACAVRARAAVPRLPRAPAAVGPGQVPAGPGRGRGGGAGARPGTVHRLRGHPCAAAGRRRAQERLRCRDGGVGPAGRGRRGWAPDHRRRPGTSRRDRPGLVPPGPPRRGRDVRTRSPDCPAARCHCPHARRAGNARARRGAEHGSYRGLRPGHRAESRRTPAGPARHRRRRLPRRARHRAPPRRTTPTGSIHWPTPANGSTPSPRTTTTSTGIQASDGTRPPASTSAPPKRSVISAPSLSPPPTPDTPNASADDPHHPKYPRPPGSTTRRNAGYPHHKPHNHTNVSLDLTATARAPSVCPGSPVRTSPGSRSGRSSRPPKPAGPRTRCRGLRGLPSSKRPSRSDVASHHVMIKAAALVPAAALQAAEKQQRASADLSTAAVTEPLPFPLDEGQPGLVGGHRARLRPA